jgi:hypothetical protein
MNSEKEILRERVSSGAFLCGNKGGCPDFDEKL